MKNDTQHLDFLISQYVDGCLEGANKKSVEQKLLTDPGARGLYGEHRETQDLLDDWGNRIPLIHWDEFDQKLAARLEHEVVGGERGSIFRRWMKPVAAAAALFVAATVGYGWHAMSHQAAAPGVGGLAQVSVEKPHTVVITEMAGGGGLPGHASMSVEEAQAMGMAVASWPRELAEFSGPPNGEAAQSLRENLAMGMGLQDVKQAVQPARVLPSAIAVGEPMTRPGSEDKPNDGAFPQ